MGVSSVGNRLKIERTLGLDDNLFCLCNITKDYILYVFTTRHDIPLAIHNSCEIFQFERKESSTLLWSLIIMMWGPCARLRGGRKQYKLV